MLKVFCKIFRLIDCFFAAIVSLIFIAILVLRRIFGKIKINTPKNKILSLTKDSINKILESNSPNYFDWDFTRPFASVTYILFIGDEKTHIFRLGKKVIGLNILMPFEKVKKFAPFTIRTIQQLYGFICTIKLIEKVSPKVLEVMFPSKLAVRSLLTKFLLPIKIVTQVRGNLDLIYYFNPFPAFWPFKMSFSIFELFQIMWDKLISLLFYRSCDLVIGYNVNNMLSAISNGAHPSKTRLSRIKIELSMLDTKVPLREEVLEIPANGKIISLWSRLSSEKLVLEAIQAFEKLLAMSDEEVHFLIIGDGPEKDRIQKYRELSSYKDKIYLLGQKNRDFIASVATYSDLVIVPYGGSSLVEAVMMGKPVVAFDIEWHNELIRNGETGWLADFPDCNHLAQKMLEALSNPKEAQKRARAAKALAVKVFDVKEIDKLEAKYFQKLFF